MAWVRMKKKSEIPSHDYHQAAATVEQIHGGAQRSPHAQLPFTLTKFEIMNESAQVNYAHRHDFYEVLYICEGEGTHIIDFEPYPIQPFTFYFLAKDQIHFWQLEKPLKGYALLFSEEFLGVPSSSVLRAHDFSFFHHVGYAPRLRIESENLSMVNGLLEDIEQEFGNEKARSLSVLRAYLHILLTKLNRLYLVAHPDEHSESTASLVRQFERLVAENFLTDHSVQDYADRIGVSSSHLRDRVKAITGHAPGQIIRQALVLEAKRLLAHSNATIAEIGYRLNFEDPSYFGRLFKRESGLSPADFRKQIREQYQITSE